MQMGYKFYNKYLILFATTNAIDLVCTYIVLRYGGHEFNPIIRHILHIGGFQLAVVYKIVICLLIVFICDKYEWYNIFKFVTRCMVVFAGLMILSAIYAYMFGTWQPFRI